MNWATASGALYPHVSQVFTNPVTGTDQSTDLTWEYNYSGDMLASVCPPQDWSHCTSYTYTPGSDYPESVLDTGPASYWRLDETSGTTAASSVMLNEGTDNATYFGATGTDTGPLAGSSAMASTFDGTSSQVTLPQNLVSGESYQSVSLWFKTTTANGVLFSYQSSPLSAGTTTSSYTPSLYIGSDRKLHGEFWQGSIAPMASSATVTDGNWHQATLTAAGNTQTLYLDGVQQGTSLAGTVSVSAQADDYIGAGFLGGNWPNEADYQKSGGTGYATYFTGDISDAAFWTRPLTANEVTTLYGAGTHQADLLTGVTRPSGKTYAQVSYDPLSGRTTSVTDDNGGTWTLQPATVGGSSQPYVASVLGNEPSDYWRLGDSWTSDAVNQVAGGTATYNNVTQGLPGGQFADTTMDSFNGTTSDLVLPSLVDAAGNQTLSLWFKTSTAGGVLFSSSAATLPTASTPTDYAPSLYVGSDGHLYAEFWNGKVDPVKSTAVVDDGKWHNVVLAAGASSQTLYVDGTANATLSGSVTLQQPDQLNDYVGAGYIGGSWPAETDYEKSGNTGYASYFTGDLGEVAWYPAQLSATQVSGAVERLEELRGLDPNPDRDRHRPRRQHPDLGL